MHVYSKPYKTQYSHTYVSRAVLHMQYFNKSDTEFLQTVLSTQYLHRRGVKQSCENLCLNNAIKKKPTEGPRGGGVDGAPALQHGVSVFFSALTTGVKDCWFLM